MAYLFYGNQFDVQNVPTTTTYTSSGTTISTNTSASANVVNGLNIGTPVSGTQPASGVVTFLIPADYDLQAKQFQAVNYGAAGSSVLVSGSAGVTINGGTAAVTIVKLTGKTFYATDSNTWYSY